MTKHSDKAIRQRMRERGIRTDVGTMERVTREVNSSERERALRTEAARAGFLGASVGVPHAEQVNAARAAALKRTMRGGRAV